MSESFVDSVKDKQRVKDQLGKSDNTTLVVSRWKTEQLNLYNIRVRIKEINLGNAFIIGHSLNGRIGVQVPQIPVIGAGTLGNWDIISETPNPEKITDAGVQSIVDWLYGSTVTHYNYIAYGTGSTDFAVTQTALVVESDRVVAQNGGPLL